MNDHHSLKFRSFLLILVFLERPAQADLTRTGTFYRKIDEFSDSDSLDENNVQILAHMQCTGKITCNYLAKSKEEAKSYEMLSEKPGQEAHDIWKRETRTGFKDCKHAFDYGVRGNQVIDVRLKNGSLSKVFCDMITDGGGWTVLQQRNSKATSFEKLWADFKNGFGDLQNSFWLGLDAVYQLTSGGNSMLRIELKDVNGRSGFAKYSGFEIGDENEGYSLSVKYNTGNIGDSLGHNNGVQFSTADKSDSLLNLASLTHGAWWHISDYTSNLNNFLSNGIASDGLDFVKWETWNNSKGLISYTEMKFRRET